MNAHLMESQKGHLAGCTHSVRLKDGMGVGATPVAWDIQKSPSPSFLPLEGGGPEVGVKFSPLTPTLSSFGKLRTVSLSNPHGGERENEVKNDYFMPASQNGSMRLFARLSNLHIGI